MNCGDNINIELCQKDYENVLEKRFYSIFKKYTTTPQCSVLFSSMKILIHNCNNTKQFGNMIRFIEDQYVTLNFNEIVCFLNGSHFYYFWKKIKEEEEIRASRSFTYLDL